MELTFQQYPAHSGHRAARPEIGAFMIHSQGKRYQLVFWERENRDGLEPALKLEFDCREEAEAAFEANRTDRRFRSGIFIEWHKVAQDWDLIERYPE